MKSYARRGVTHKEELRMENHEVHGEVTHGEELRIERTYFVAKDIRNCRKGHA